MLKMNYLALGRRLCIQKQSPSFTSQFRHSSVNNWTDELWNHPKDFRDAIREPSRNPNQVIIRGDICDITRETENDLLKVKVKVKRLSMRKDGLQYIKSSYYNVNFYGTNDPTRNFKIPKHVTVGDNVTTYSNINQAERSRKLYLKGYAMVRHDVQVIIQPEDEWQLVIFKIHQRALTWWFFAVCAILFPWYFCRTWLVLL